VNPYLFNFHTLAATIAIVTGIAHPYISALLTRAPSWLTGILTSLQAAAAGFIAELAIAPDNYDWRKALGIAISSWILAFAAQTLHLSGTTVQDKLHAVGTKATPDTGTHKSGS
jgi:hypothetical protein